MAPTLVNAAIRLDFDEAAAGLAAITNKLTGGETYAVADDTFAIETAAFRRTQTDMRQVVWSATAEAVTARYADDDLEVDVTYELRPDAPFFLKRLAVTFADDAALIQITLSRPAFRAAGLQLACCRHPDFDWVTEYVTTKHPAWGVPRRPDASEPSRTFFGRTARGGLFTGMAMPYDNSRIDGGAVVLGYAPSLKVRAGERLDCETVYFGVYRRDGRDARASAWTPVPAAAVIGKDAPHGFNGAVAAGLDAGSDSGAPAGTTAAVKALPLPAESAAMAAMASRILGPPRHGLMAFACGWHCQMEQGEYDTEEKLDGDLRSLEFCAACGLDGVSDCHPWGGESQKMAALREGDAYELGERPRRFLEHARELGLKVVQWPTMNNTHPWKEYGGPFRLDRPEWLRGVEGDALRGVNADNFRRREANCFACEPFYNWLEKVVLEDALGTGLYDAWCMDGDFWGTGAYFHTVLPATCLAENHEHLPGDANHACQRRLDRMIAEVRRCHPGIYIGMCRPPMDLGVWALRHVDACFTLIESGTGGSNLAAGDEVRTASRIRVHHQFFPHWLDWSLLFPSYAGAPYPQWPVGHIDYLMLSAMSCSPNLLLYLPTKSGIPEADKAEIRKWLDWGRANAEYLLVRHDLFDWPGKGVVDGSAHLLGDRGLIFLFNSSGHAKIAEFALTAEDTGFNGTAPVAIRQEYPGGGPCHTVAPGATMRWPVPPETAVVLRLTPRKHWERATTVRM
jgi:hypothetical protein